MHFALDGQHTHKVELYHDVPEWQFPNDRFTKYEASDEPWCRYFGIGREVIVRRTTTLNNCLIQRDWSGSLLIECLPEQSDIIFGLSQAIAEPMPEEPAAGKPYETKPEDEELELL